jgi:Tfp pilus assembly protein PilV
MDGHQTQGSAPSHRRNTGGFLLVDAMIAVAVFSIGVLALVALQAAATKRTGENLRDSQAQSCLQTHVERLKALDFNDPALNTDVLMTATCTIDGNTYTVNYIVFDNNSTDSISTIAPQGTFPELYQWDGMFGDPANPRVDIASQPTGIPQNTKVIMVYSRFDGKGTLRSPVATVNTRV